MANSFEEMLAAVAAKPRKTVDVSVIFDEEIVDEKASLEAALETADDDARLGSVSEADKIRERLIRLQDDAEDSRVWLRFTRLPARAWMELTSFHEVRTESEIDKFYGFNWDAVGEAAARYRDPRTGQAYGHRLDGGETHELTPEQWDIFYDRLPGGEAAVIRDAIFGINHFGPEQKRESLEKTFGATSRSVNK